MISWLWAVPSSGFQPSALLLLCCFQQHVLQFESLVILTEGGKRWWLIWAMVPWSARRTSGGPPNLYLLAMRQRMNPQRGRVSCTDSPINFISLVHYQVLLWAPVEPKTTKMLSVLKSGHVFHGILEALETLYQRVHFSWFCGNQSSCRPVFLVAWGSHWK